jgi:hypothetical protein
MQRPILCFLLLSSLAATAQQDAGIDPARARRYFQEARWAAEDEGGRMWGRSLYGPMLFFDPATGTVVANQADKASRLQAQDGVFRGAVAKDFAGANTALDWAGVRWTVVLWPLPEATVDRLRLILHECWHRLQADLGLPALAQNNEHLGTRDGRIWLLLEYRALSRALPAWGKERKQALEDALAFRAYRRSLFPGAATEEDRMEMNEGLAEYTGINACGFCNNEARYYMAGRLKLAELKPALSYAFAYETGPAYGLMLDMQSKTWRQELTPDASLSALLARVAHVAPGEPTLADVTARADRYDGEALIAAETAAAARRETQAARYRRELVDGPLLVAPLVKRSFTFDPNEVVPLAGKGTVYIGCKFIEEWGVLTVDGAALADKAMSSVSVPAPASAGDLRGPSWTLQLNAGWKLVPGKRKGDFTIRKG